MRCLAVLVLLVVAACADSGQSAQREIPDRLLDCSYSGGTIKPIANTQTGIVRGASLQSASGWRRFSRGQAESHARAQP